MRYQTLSFWMKNSVKIFLTLGLILFFNQGLSVFALELGDKAPNLMGADARSSKMLNLYRLMVGMSFKKDAAGQPVIGSNGKYMSVFTRNVITLNFFARSCVPCIREIPTYNRIARSFKGEAVKMLYVNVDPGIDQDQITRLIEKYKIDIPVMMPNQKEVIRTYDAKSLPLLVVIDQKRKIVYKMTGFNENLEKDLTRTINNLLAK